MSTDVRVRALHLAGPREPVSQMVGRLEDAFRLASLPGVPANAIVFVRSMDLGDLPPHISAAALAQRIDRLLLAMGVRPMRGSGDISPDSPVVWFADRVEAAARLAYLVGLGRNVADWYWRAAFPECLSAPTRAATLRCILASVRSGDGGLVAAVAFLDRLLRESALGPMAEALRPDDAGDLIPGGQALRTDSPNRRLEPGMRNPSTGTKSTNEDSARLAAIPTTRSEWRDFLTAKGRSWSLGDPRLQGLASAALLASHPALLYSRNFAATLGAFVDSIPVSGARSVAIAGFASQAQGHAPRSPEPMEQRSGSVESSFAGPAAGSDSGHQVVTDSGSVRSAVTPQHHTAACGPAETPRLVADRSEPEIGKVAGRSPQTVSEYAGFPFLIGLLRHLRLERCLLDHAWLAETDFPAQLLRRAASHLRIPKQDPVLGFLPEYHGEHGAWHPYVAPEGWLDWLPPVGRVGLPAAIGSAGGWRWMTIRHGRLLVAAWCATRRPTLGGWSRCRPVSRSPSTPVGNDLAASWLLAAAAFLRRYQGPTLRSLVRRPGRIEATRTHLDASFDHNVVDIRVRRLGLDLDPGWVPWLGRVVSYHYDFGPNP